jgi:hypothetical protein
MTDLSARKLPGRGTGVSNGGRNQAENFTVLFVTEWTQARKYPNA